MSFGFSFGVLVVSISFHGTMRILANRGSLTEGTADSTTTAARTCWTLLRSLGCHTNAHTCTSSSSNAYASARACARACSGASASTGTSSCACPGASTTTGSCAGACSIAYTMDDCQCRGCQYWRPRYWARSGSDCANYP